MAERRRAAWPWSGSSRHVLVDPARGALGEVPSADEALAVDEERGSRVDPAVLGLLGVGVDGGGDRRVLQARLQLRLVEALLDRELDEVPLRRRRLGPFGLMLVEGVVRLPE